MRRTTIFRSELTAMAAALVLPLAAAAQQPPAIQRPILQAQQPQRALPPGTPAPAAARPAPQPAPSQPAPPPRGSVTITSGPGGALPQSAAAPPATHVVAPGETLWSLAQQFLGDPLLWPEIYRLNTNVVEDPHWIYVGEELRIGAEGADQPTSAAVTTAQSFTVTPQGDTTRQAPPVQQGPAAPTTGPTIFAQQAPRARSADATIEQGSARAYRAVREGEYYSAGFLTEGQPLATGRILGNMRTFSSQARSRSTSHLFEDVIVSASASEPLQAGDLLLSFRRGDEVQNWGEMVLPTGLLRVKGPEGGQYAATVVRAFGTISDNQEVLKIQSFGMTTNQRAQPVSDGVVGHVIRMRDPHEVAQRQAVLFIDRGANDGVKLGDMFQLYRVRTDEEHGGALEQDQARAIVVNTRASTSTVIIVELYRGDIGPQSSARQVRRMPS
jgi:LysM repeat protein